MQKDNLPVFCAPSHMCSSLLSIGKNVCLVLVWLIASEELNSGPLAPHHFPYTLVTE